MHFHSLASKIRAKIQKQGSSSGTVFSRQESKGESEAPAPSKKATKHCKQELDDPNTSLSGSRVFVPRRTKAEETCRRQSERVGDPTEHDPVAFDSDQITGAPNSISSHIATPDDEIQKSTKDLGPPDNLDTRMLRPSAHPLTILLKLPANATG